MKLLASYKWPISISGDYFQNIYSKMEKKYQIMNLLMKRNRYNHHPSSPSLQRATHHVQLALCFLKKLDSRWWIWWLKKQYTLASRQACVLAFCFLIRQEVMFPWKPEALFNYVWNLLTVPRLISWEKCSKAEATWWACLGKWVHELIILLNFIIILKVVPRPYEPPREK